MAPLAYRLEQLTVRHLGPKAPAALHALDLRVAQGEQIALIGPSGAGKSTLLATLACAHAPSEGRFEVLGVSPWRLSHGARHRLRARVFLAPQTPPLPPRQRVVAAVLAARLPHWSVWQAFASLVKPSDPDAAFDALQRFGLGHKLYARVDRLSGGERQRCALARMLLSSADVFLVDEPLSALDPTLSHMTLTTVQQEAAARQATLVCSLHQVDMARAHFARIVGLRDGRVVFDCPREQVSDAMVAALYANDSATAHDEAVHDSAHEPAHSAPERLSVGACF